MNNSILLYTTFNGKPVIGGSYNPLKRLYVKKCKHVNAGKHPHKCAYGGIDDDIIQQLEQHGCRTMQLCLADGTVLFIRFEVFKAQGFSVNWRDPRFGPRWYAPSHLWDGTLEEAKAAKMEAPAPERRKEKEQLSLFDTAPTPGERRQAYETGNALFSRTGRYPE